MTSAAASITLGHPVRHGTGNTEDGNLVVRRGSRMIFTVPLSAIGHVSVSGRGVELHAPDDPRSFRTILVAPEARREVLAWVTTHAGATPPPSAAVASASLTTFERRALRRLSIIAWSTALLALVIVGAAAIFALLLVAGVSAIAGA